ncbi:putative ribosomal protein L34Ae [Tanacetum coccineum]
MARISFRFVRTCSREVRVPKQSRFDEGEIESRPIKDTKGERRGKKYRETGKKIEANLTQVDKVTPLNSKRFEHEEKDKEEIFGDTNTVGSTSKSPSEWRSSITCRDTGYDPFSSSSRRSCPKWESYTFFQKYDEEMLFLDRISVQKLKETDSDDEKKDEYLGSRISSESFLVIMDESIKTFMNFLRADKENHFHKFTAHFFPIKNPKTSVDPTHILLLKKLNHKKKLKLKYLRRLRKCFRKRKSKQVNEMEVLMAQIDLKIVSRVLRTSDLNEEQLRWCEDKMTKVKVCDMKLQRDSSPLFFTLPRH